MSQLKIKTNKACRLLGMFLLSRIQQQQDAKQLSQLASDINYNYDKILIEETSKPIIYHPKKRRKSSNVSTSSINPSHERNINHILISLYNFKGFIKYIKYQNLSKSDLVKTAEVLKHEFYKRGSYIFKVNDKSDAFYGVITGKVSIRKYEYIDLTKRFHNEITQSEYINNNKTFDISIDNFVSVDNVEENINSFHDNEKSFYNFGDEFEYEVISISKGMCFGEWGVVYNIPRTASAYCPEDTHVLKLEKEHFDQVLGSKFFQSDMNKIKFIIQKFPILNSNYHFKYLLTKITPLFYDKGTLVYTQFDKAENIYLIYQGECSYIHLPDIKSKDDFIMRQHDIKYITTLSVGAIVGLEAYKQNEHNYEYNLLATRDFTVLLKINVEYISTKIKEFNEFIKPLYDLQCKIINESLCNIKQSSINTKQKCGTLTFHKRKMHINVNEIINEIQYHKKNEIKNNKNVKMNKLIKKNKNKNENVITSYKGEAYIGKDTKYDQKKCYRKGNYNGVLNTINNIYNSEYSTINTSSMKDMFNMNNKLLINCNSSAYIQNRKCLSKPRSLKSITIESNFSMYMKYGKEGKIGSLTERTNSLPNKRKYNLNGTPSNYGDVTTSMIQMIYKKTKLSKHRIFNSGNYTLPLISKIKKDKN